MPSRRPSGPTRARATNPAPTPGPSLTSPPSTSPASTSLLTARTGYGQDGYADQGYGQGAYPPDAPGQGGYTSDGYSQAGYAPEGYGQDPYGQDGYAADPYAQPGLDPSAGQQYGQQYGQDASPVPGRQPRSRSSRSGSSRSGQRPTPGMSGIRMILYLAGAVIGVVLIVLLVVHLSKSGSGTGTAGTPTGSSSAPSATGTAVKYTLTAPAMAGPYQLNPTATKDFSNRGERRAALAAQQIKPMARVPGHERLRRVRPQRGPGILSFDFKAVEFVGYDGTFDPQAVIKYEKTQLVSISMVNPGPHGGEMMCG